MSGGAFSCPLDERHRCQPESDAEADQAGGDEMLERSRQVHGPARKAHEGGPEHGPVGDVQKA